MSLQIPRRLRAICAAVALGAYMLPALVAVAAELAHGAEHALGLLESLERSAAAMGVAHLHDVQNDRRPDVYAHAHGGEPHAHDERVGALLIAAEAGHGHESEAAVTAALELSSHVPAAGVPSVLSMADVPAIGTETQGASSPHALPPPLPPPRA